ncbi:P-loop containing nucleoside triphosphate hydrolase protein [Sarocladium strictum]
MGLDSTLGYAFFALVVVQVLLTLLQAVNCATTRRSGPINKGQRWSVAGSLAILCHVVLILISLLTVTLSIGSHRYEFRHPQQYMTEGVFIASLLALTRRCISNVSVWEVSYCGAAFVIWTLKTLLCPLRAQLELVIPALYLIALIATMGVSWTVSDSMHPSALHPISSAPIVPWFTLSWLDGLLFEASRGPISASGLWEPGQGLSVSLKGDDSGAGGVWDDWSRPIAHKVSESLTSLLLRTSPGLLLSSAAFGAVDIVMVFSQPFLLRSLLEHRNAVSAISLFLITLIGGVTEAHMKYQLRIIGIKVRAALTTAICDNGLMDEQSSSAPDPSVLMEVDLPHIFEFIENYHIAWMAPLQVLLGLGALVYILDVWSVLSGLAASITLFLIVQVLMAKIQALMYRIMSAKDVRVELVTQVLHQAKQLKLAALQTLYGRKVWDARDREMSLTASMAKLNASVVSLMSLTSASLMLFSLTVFIFRGGPLQSEVLFPALAFLFNITRSFGIFTQIVMRYQACLTGLNRIRDMLTGKEMEQLDQVHRYSNNSVSTSDSAESRHPRVRLKDCALHPQGVPIDQSSKPLLSNCSLEAAQGELIVIAGPVGSGKTTIIRALVENQDPVSGGLEVQGTVAYAPQQPFIIRGTVRENILFGLSFDPTLYERVLKATCLRDDLFRMPSGDSNVLGGLGVAISGGQKSRIGLARTLYARRQIVILDDPLAAVDPKVSAALVKNVLGPDGLLQNSIRIVCSNSSPLFRAADRLYVIKGSTLEETTAAELANMFPPVNKPESSPADGPGSTSSTTITASLNSDGAFQYGSLPAAKLATSVRTYEVREDDDLMNEETPLVVNAANGGDVSHGSERVAFRHYLRFMALAKRGGWLIVILLAATAKCLDVVGVYFLKLAAEQNEQTGTRPTLQLALFGLCGLFSATVSGSFVFAAYFLCLIPVSEAVHSELTTNVLATKLRFFETTPVGSILNCFTNDMQKLDSSVNGGMMTLAGILVTCSSSILVILVTSILSAVYLLPIGAFYFSVQAYYLSACRQLRYLENVARGPILDSVAEVYNGKAVINAFGQLSTFSQRARKAIDEHTRIWGPFLALDAWLLMRLQLLASIVQLLSAGLLIWLAVSPSTLGLVMNFIVQITSQFNVLVQARATLEADFTSVLRIWDMAALEPECSHEKREDDYVPRNWPEHAAIHFESFSMGYDPQGPLCLRNIDLDIAPGEHVAIVGRTGAGKSSVATSLLRGIGPEVVRAGRILIDGVDISRMSIERLRRSITLMTQDPLLFTGSLRDNLDPERTKSDAELEKSIQECQLDQVLGVAPGEDVLNARITNDSLSSGQIQTIALARAMLSHNSIIVLDEVTASMSSALSAATTNVIRSKFRNCTLLSITHDMASALAYDKVLVLQAGQVAEFDAPAALLNDDSSVFSQLVAESDLE